MYQIIPGILEKNWNEIETKLEAARGFTNRLHIDFIDGKFVNNKTFFNPEPFKKYSDYFLLEAHLMVIDPEEYVESFANAGFRRFLGHVEHMSSQKDFIKEAKKYGEACLALDGPTHINSIKVPFDDLDGILVYTSNKVGFTGPPLVDDRLDKIRHLRKLTNIPIEADGGINNKTIEKAKAAGATRFVSTSFIWNFKEPADGFDELTKLIL